MASGHMPDAKDEQASSKAYRTTMKKRMSGHPQKIIPYLMACTSMQSVPEGRLVQHSVTVDYLGHGCNI